MKTTRRLAGAFDSRVAELDRLLALRERYFGRVGALPPDKQPGGTGRRTVVNNS